MPGADHRDAHHRQGDAGEQAGHAVPGIDEAGLGAVDRRRGDRDQLHRGQQCHAQDPADLAEPREATAPREAGRGEGEEAADEPEMLDGEPYLQAGEADGLERVAELFRRDLPGDGQQPGGSGGTERSRPEADVPAMAEVKSNSRRQKADATRRRIVAAAHQEFAANGYQGATIASIARRAEVAAQTVYFVFHTKAALISAVVETAVVGDEDPTPPERSAWWAEMVASPSASEALRTFVRGAAPSFARASAISGILRAAALTDEELAGTYAFQEDLRHRSFRQAVEVVASKGALRSGLTVDTATDVLMTVYGDGAYLLMTTERGWSHDQVVDWWCEALPLLLLDDRERLTG